MSPNRQKRTAIALKSKSIRNELADLQAQTWNAQAWRHRLQQHTYTFHPVPLDDPELSSRLFGPQMKCVQWEPTSK